jgi:hypothetical protein
MEYERGESQTDAPARANHHLHAAQFATAISSWHSADWLKPGGCGGFSSLMILRLSAAHCASFRRRSISALEYAQLSLEDAKHFFHVSMFATQDFNDLGHNVAPS